MPNKRDLKAYLRYDGSGRIVPGSLILRKNKPKTGKWTEMQGYQCCNIDQQTITVNVESIFPFNYPDFVIQSEDSSPYFYIFNSGTDVTVANVIELADYYNSRFKYLGHFEGIGTTLLYTPSLNIAETFANNGTTVIAAYSFSD
jgi:hypothetical protein